MLPHLSFCRATIWLIKSILKGDQVQWGGKLGLMGAITAPGEEPVPVGGGGHWEEEASERWGWEDSKGGGGERKLEEEDQATEKEYLKKENEREGIQENVFPVWWQTACIWMMLRRGEGKGRLPGKSKKEIFLLWQPVLLQLGEEKSECPHWKNFFWVRCFY